MLTTNQKKKIYWRSIIKQIEKKVHEESKLERIKNYDFYPTLPKKLQQRVSRIIPWDYSDEIINENNRRNYESALPTDAERKSRENMNMKKSIDFNESTCSLIERKEEEYPKFDLNLQHTHYVVNKPTRKKKHNWMSTFICAPLKERIKWDSKIYPMKENAWEKHLDEQAEELMERSAEKFAVWLNNLGSKCDKKKTKEDIKALFSIECNPLLLSSIETDPKQVKAIGRAVAKKWNIPHLSMELKYENYVNSTLKTAPTETRTVAFGRTIPYKDRPWIYNLGKISFASVFPEKLKTGEYLFSGMTHLRSAKAFIHHCREHPRTPRPRYLLKKGYFKTAEKKITDIEPPLYELLKVQ